MNKFTKILKLANRFLVLAGEFGLEHLLGEALRGDRESFLVFLDMLEEQMPIVRANLDINSYSLETTLSILAPVFPSIIKMDKTDFSFPGTELPKFNFASTDTTVIYPEAKVRIRTKVVIFTIKPMFSVRRGDEYVQMPINYITIQPNSSTINLDDVESYTYDRNLNPIQDSRVLDIFHSWWEKAINDYYQLRDTLQIPHHRKELW